MAEIQVRPAQSADLPHLMALDHSYSTESVWQMEARADAGQHAITFRAARLPRPIRVSTARDSQRLPEAWNQRVCFLVAESDGQVRGYLNLVISPLPETGWIADLGVERRARRSGIGAVLLASALHWARQNQLRRVVLEVQSKNYPAICFAQKNGLEFCGYNDRYYPNQDVALFFGSILR